MVVLCLSPGILPAAPHILYDRCMVICMPMNVEIEMHVEIERHVEIGMLVDDACRMVWVEVGGVYPIEW